MNQVNKGKLLNILFLCTGNSARSSMAESILNQLGSDRFRAFSAGSHPKGHIHPLALRLLQQLNYTTVGLRSKSWEEFTGTDAPELNLVITVCDHAAAQACPVWAGQPTSSHWSIPDPAAVKGVEENRIQAFESAYELLLAKITSLVQLPIRSLSTSALEFHLDHISGILAPVQNDAS
jgi:protein-tyrosine-phosphatase